MDIQKVSIENLMPGMQNIDIVGMVTRMSRKKYGKEGEAKSGELLSIAISDESGNIRMVLWNDEIERAADIKEGDVIRVQGYVRQGMFGPELRLGRYGKLEKLHSALRRSAVAQLKDGFKAEIRAALVQVFESNPFYEVCPQCRVSLKEKEDKYVCITHGEVEPDYALHVSGVLDDGTASIRCVMFKEQAEKILGMTAQKAKDLVLRKGLPALFANAQLREYVLEGNVRKSRLFERLEFIINRIEDVDVKQELNALLEMETAV